MSKPRLIITGATGFLGGRLMRELRREYCIYAMGRRSPTELGLPQGDGIEWFRVDIGDRPRLTEAFAQIAAEGGATMLLHLAAYYDFTGDDSPEYRRTNVEGTRNLLELAEPLGLRRFVYASSVAACPFPAAGETIDEATPPTLDIPYARSKRDAEALVLAFQHRLPTCIVRPAAVFSEWCEYEALDVFLQTWCSRAWNARIVGGHGSSAVPYLHVEDMLSFFLRVVERCDDIESAEVLIASPDGSTSHLELFDAATNRYFGVPHRPLLVSQRLAHMGMRARELVGRITGHMPFERSWMADFIDLKLHVDSRRTRQRLNWAPAQDRSVLHTIPRMVDNLRDDPVTWKLYSERRKKRPVHGLSPSDLRLLSD